MPVFSPTPPQTGEPVSAGIWARTIGVVTTPQHLVWLRVQAGCAALLTADLRFFVLRGGGLPK